MSVEVIAVVLSAVGIVLTLGTAFFAGCAWFVRRIDAVDAKLSDQIDAVDAKLSDRIDGGLASLDTKLTARMDRLETKLDALASEMTEVKIAVARIEGPERRFYAPAR